MGKGDRRHSNKSTQRRGQRKKKEHERKLKTERATRIAAADKAGEKKTRTARKPASPASS